jgi:hypothetical protein
MGVPMPEIERRGYPAANGCIVRPEEMRAGWSRVYAMSHKATALLTSKGEFVATIKSMFSLFRQRLKVNKIQRQGTRPGAAIEHVHVTNPWHAVAISTGVSCCKASVFLRQTRFLSSQAPPLPLQGCSQPKSCVCKYKHFGDRRSGPRRVTESELFQNALSRHKAAAWTQERRARRGRRATDGH